MPATQYQLATLSNKLKQKLQEIDDYPDFNQNESYRFLAAEDQIDANLKQALNEVQTDFEAIKSIIDNIPEDVLSVKEKNNFIEKLFSKLPCEQESNWLQALLGNFTVFKKTLSNEEKIEHLVSAINQLHNIIEKNSCIKCQLLLTQKKLLNDSIKKIDATLALYGDTIALSERLILKSKDYIRTYDNNHTNLVSEVKESIKILKNKESDFLTQRMALDNAIHDTEKNINIVTEAFSTIFKMAENLDEKSEVQLKELSKHTDELKAYYQNTRNELLNNFYKAIFEGSSRFEEFKKIENQLNHSANTNKKKYDLVSPFCDTFEKKLLKNFHDEYLSKKQTLHSITILHSIFINKFKYKRIIDLKAFILSNVIDGSFMNDERYKEYIEAFNKKPIAFDNSIEEGCNLFLNEQLELHLTQLKNTIKSFKTDLATDKKIRFSSKNPNTEEFKALLDTISIQLENVKSDYKQIPEDKFSKEFLQWNKIIISKIKHIAQIRAKLKQYIAAEKMFQQRNIEHFNTKFKPRFDKIKSEINEEIDRICDRHIWQAYIKTGADAINQIYLSNENYHGLIESLTPRHINSIDTRLQKLIDLRNELDSVSNEHPQIYANKFIETANRQLDYKVLMQYSDGVKWDVTQFFRKLILLIKQISRAISCTRAENDNGFFGTISRASKTEAKIAECMQTILDIEQEMRQEDDAATMAVTTQQLH